MCDDVHQGGEKLMLRQGLFDFSQSFHWLARRAEGNLVGPGHHFEETEAEVAGEIAQDIAETAASDPSEHFQN